MSNNMLNLLKKANAAFKNISLKVFANRKIAIKAILFASIAGLAIGSANAVTNESFKQWIQMVKKQALNKGYDSKFLDDVFKGINSPLEEIVKSDRNQVEFKLTFAEYFNRKDLDQRVKNIKSSLNSELNNYLKMITGVYSPPRGVLLSLWDLESSRGRFKGTNSVLHSVATLSWDKRRRKYFTAELFAVLDILRKDLIDVDEFVGSWAGGSGHMQFMPSNILVFGKDIDGDGKINVWESPADAIGSGAYFLQKRGWVKNMPWGWEIEVKDSFNYPSKETSKSVAYWLKNGVINAENLGRRLSSLPKDQVLTFSAPAGVAGPYFLLSSNYDVILRWNRSDHYAHTVGILSDLVAGKSLKYPVPANGDHVDADDIKAMQAKLKNLGLYSGKIDGKVGIKTNRAMQAWQKKYSKSKNLTKRVNKQLISAIKSSK